MSLYEVEISVMVFLQKVVNFTESVLFYSLIHELLNSTKSCLSEALEEQNCLYYSGRPCIPQPRCLCGQVKFLYSANMFQI